MASKEQKVAIDIDIERVTQTAEEFGFRFGGNRANPNWWASDGRVGVSPFVSADGSTKFKVIDASGATLAGHTRSPRDAFRAAQMELDRPGTAPAR